LFRDALFTTETPPNGKRLESWKEIAAYLNREVRTAMRWEKERSLPVHRIPGKRSGVYTSTAEVDAWLRAAASNHSDGDGVLVVPPPTPQATRPRPSVWVIVSAIILLGIATGLLAVSIARPVEPHLGSPVQITNDGLVKGDLMFGKRTLFFISSDGERRTLMRMPASGGAMSSVVSPRSPWLLSISPDESELLVWQIESLVCPCPMWVVSPSDASQRRLPVLARNDATWSPDGKTLAFASGNALYLARRDGTMPRRLTTVPDTVVSLRWSPDGKRIRLMTESKVSWHSGRLWEVELDRPLARRVLPSWTRAPQDWESVGRWTPDGNFFVFAAVHDGIPGLFAIRERRPFYAGGSAAPIRLTTNTEGVSDPTPSADGKKLFAIIQSSLRGELIRLEAKSGQSVIWPAMPGLSAGHVAFSPDGHEAAYVSYPEMNLWKMKADGTGKRQLTFGISKAAMPQWSPDGSRIAYMGSDAGTTSPTKVRLISADGGHFEQPVAWSGWQGIPTWTPDGKTLIFGENWLFNPIPASCKLHRFDLSTRQTSDLPGTTGLWTARACPTGRYVAATTRDNSKLVLYDIRTERVIDLASFLDSKVGDNPIWSKDGKFIYIDAPLAPDPAVYRIRIADKHRERVASLKGIQRANMDYWIGLTPDGSPLVTRRVQGSEIYSWDWVAQ
jgi:Tol biopolymer transport system component